MDKFTVEEEGFFSPGKIIVFSFLFMILVLFGIK
jgi:hypothetical protein